MHDQLPNKNTANTWDENQTIADSKKIYLGGGTSAYI
jgi:hypothetical protein